MSRFQFTDPLRSWLANNADQACESPMEALFDSCLHLLMGADATMRQGWSVQHQSPIATPSGGGRADFRLTCWDVSIYIEIDGRPFHERSEDQGERDRQRDRLLIRDGHTVIRFMGSEVHRNPFACASEAIKTCRDLADRTNFSEKSS